MRNVAAAIALVMISVGGAGADIKSSREAYDNCLIAGIVKFKDLCEPADQLAKAVAVGCNPQLIALMRSLPHMKTVDEVELAAKHRQDKTDEVMSLLLEYRLQHPCQ
jgi:hypothetical protein